MTEKKYALYAFNGDMMCFVHVLLNALDMHFKGYAVNVIIEGSATKLIKDFHDNPNHQFHEIYYQLKNLGLISAVCHACASKMGVVDEVNAEKFPLIGTMSGHPPMSDYLEQGFQIITF